MVHFFDFTGLYDRSWFLFGLITVLSATIGNNFVFRKLQIPVITGYMIIGFICGPYALGLMTIAETGELAYVNHAALSFIAFSAGAEIYLPEIIPLITPILWISMAMIAFTMFIGTLITFGVGGTDLLPWMVGYTSCNFTVAMLIATILAARSPTSVLAVVREMQARGPITSILIGITVAGDVFILTIFAIVMSMAQNMCSGDAFDGATFAINLIMIPCAFIWGYILGLIVVQLLQFKNLKHLILPIGFFTYLVCDYIEAVSTASGKFEISIDPLLICITAGYVAGNSQYREELCEYFKSLSMYVFIPFFTQVGIQLNLPVLISAMGFSITASLIRAFCMFLGTTAGGMKVGIEQHKAMRMWMGLLPQAGVSLGLAGIVGHTFESSFGNDFQSTVLGIILVNQVIGPLGAKYLIKYCEEDGKGDAGEEDFKHIVMAAHDGFVEEKTYSPMMTQTEDTDFSLLDEESAEFTKDDSGANENAADATDGANGYTGVSDGTAEEGAGVELTTFGRVITDEHSVHSTGTGSAIQTQTMSATRRVTTASGAQVKVMTARANRRGSVRGGNYTAVEESSSTTGEEANNPMWASGKDNWMGFLKENL